MRTTAPLKFLSAVCLTLALCTLAWAETTPPWRDWQSALLKDHALTGQIWSVREKRFVSPETLAKSVAEARFVLAGEIHDNPDHHRLQAWLVDKASANRKPALVMEMITQDETPALQAYLASPKADAAGLGAALKWEARGWPEWRIYQPIADAAFRLKLPLHSGDIDRPTLKKVGKEGMDVIDTKRRTALLLDMPLGAALESALLDDLYKSHCELMPRNALGRMVNVQRLRDAVLADSMIRAAGNGDAILIAGNGHVQADGAVPWYLTRRVPDAKIVTVLLLEAEKTAKTPEELIPTGPDGEPVADYVWFTPRMDREDPCEQLRKRFKKKH